MIFESSDFDTYSFEELKAELDEAELKLSGIQDELEDAEDEVRALEHEIGRRQEVDLDGIDRTQGDDAEICEHYGVTLTPEGTFKNKDGVKLGHTYRKFLQIPGNA